MTLTDARAILEVSAGATADDIHRAYRELVRVWHPDRFASDPTLQTKAQEKLKQINEAYQSLKSAEFATREPSAADSDSPLPYRDGSVQYLGTDPRLKPVIPHWSGTVQGVPAAVAVTDELGVSVLTISGSQFDELMNYPAASLICLRERQMSWFPTDNIGTNKGWTEPLPDTDVVVRFTDPERILKRGITLHLRFRNAYYAQVFVKRVCAALRLVSPDNPATTSDVAPNSIASSPSSAAVPILILLVLAIWAVAFILIIAAATK